ncbi:hypothetical protein [Butyrivibrio sp. MB2005]|uniref:hypothetical protein n=1 Tax=Butyrivibrio sp. MB2005 TaxID=1280678 RepID=UPI0003FA1F30|nr:hypothetical protein [Butyrivibrio sp. MB2005]
MNLLHRCKYKPIVFCFFVALILEVFAFNYKFWLYGSSENASFPTFSFEDGMQVEYGKSYVVPGHLTLISEDIDAYVKSIHLNVSDCNDAGWESKERQCILHITTSIMDEGHAQFYDFVQIVASPLVPETMYLPVETFGKVNKIKLTIADDLDEIVFDSIEVNSGIPFRLRIMRLLLVFGVLLALQAVLFSDYYSLDSMDFDSRKSFLIVSAFVIGLIILTLSIQNQTRDWGSSYNYSNLAKAFVNGNFFVAENTDDILANMENPYDFRNRETLGAKAVWDTAYYGDKYYIYFGVIPALILHLPYYLISGNDMTNMTATSILDVLLILASFFLVNELRKKLNKNIPLRLFLLLSTTFTLSSGLILIIKRASIYYVAIGTGLMFIMFGLTLWMNSVNDGTSCSSEIPKGDGSCLKVAGNSFQRHLLLKGILGSLCMALAVGCRPQFAMASFLGLVIYWDLIRNAYLRKKGSLIKLVILILPYVPVAAGLMYYNYARFGSPFDFGANYNLTGYDMVHMGIHPARIPIGLWYYLFNLPHIHFEFPFMYSSSLIIRYQGFIVSEPVIGGAIMMAPITWLCIADFRRKNSFNYPENVFADKALWFRRLCYIIVLIVVSVDTLMCGVLVRYQLDYRIYLIISAVIMAMSILAKDYNDKETYNKQARHVACLCVVTLIMCILTIFCQYENPDYTYPEINPVLFCRMKMFFGG